MTSSAALVIDQLWDHLEGEQGLEILFACEAGSRAWGFASPDSDYDVCFIFRRPFWDNFRVLPDPDTVDGPRLDGLDASGWDVRKALALLAKSNAALLEWLHSPVIYRAEKSFLEDLRALARDFFEPRVLVQHYTGMARTLCGRDLGADRATAKEYLHALRACLSARHVLEQGTPPPVKFRDLLNAVEGDVRTAIEELRQQKRKEEKKEVGRLSLLDRFLERELAELEDQAQTLPRKEPEMVRFDQVLQRWVGWPGGGDRSRRMRRADLTLARVRRRDLLLFEAVAGSRAFGTDHAGSDFDLRGVFVAPFSFLGSLEVLDQVSDEPGDEVYYEITRFIELLTANNPNIVELLFTPDSCLRYRHPAFALIRPELFLSRRCRETFGNYAMGQIRKARGLNKKMMNPEPRQRKHLREFCHVLQGQGAVGLAAWLAGMGLREEDCALVAVRHSPGIYAIFHESAGRGIFSRKDDSALVCSSVPKGAEPLAWLSCNRDAFRAHCRAHREYWQWVERRNEERYQTNTAHGQGYDSKNLMHTMRLLEQGLEIAREGRVTLPRPNADWLKRVKAGEFAYDDLLVMADERHAAMEEAFARSDLPEAPCRETANEVLLQIRARFG